MEHDTEPRSNNNAQKSPSKPSLPLHLRQFPFIGMNETGRIDHWRVESYGLGTENFEGRLYAWDLVEYVIEKKDTDLLYLVLYDMIRKGRTSDIEEGFLSVLCQAMVY